MAFLPAIAIALALAQGPSSITKDIPAKYMTDKPAAGAVVARVNGVDIKTEDVEPLLWQWRGADTVQDLITYQLVKGEAQKQLVDVSDQEVEEVMNQQLLAMQKQLRPGQTLDQVLLAQGFTRSRLFLRYRTEALLNAIAERQYDPKKLVKVSTIIFPHTQEAASMSLAIKRAEAAYDRLKKGDKWNDVLEASTTNQDILKTKGLLGWRELSAFPAPVQKEMEGLKTGDVTKPAETENGLQIFRIEVLGSNAKPEEKTEMRAAFTNGAKQSILDQIRAQSQIQRFYPPSGGN